jgi:adenylate kinase family enzyme
MMQNFITHRIAIIGTTGSGKSTLAKALSSRLALPHTELDDLNWLPNWRERDKDDFRQLVDQATTPAEWVIDGGYSDVRDLVWGRADTLVWLDLSFPRTASQLLRRTPRRNTLQTPCCNGNYESWGLMLSRESILLWLLKSYHRNRRLFPGALQQYGRDKTVIVLRKPAEIQAWLASI